MMSLVPSPARDLHRAALTAIPVPEWSAYLDEHSNLPGPRGNLELLEVAADLAPASLLHAWADDADEFRATVGAAGLGRLLVEGDATVLPELRRLADDDRWRVREGVAFALQRVGDADLTALHAITDAWVSGTPLVQRAAAAGECEPRLLRARAAAAHAVALLDAITRSLAALPTARRRDPDVRALRKGLGYCWSVAVAADPTAGFPALEAWAASDDDDVRWVLRENVRKARLARADADGAARLVARLG